jgi:hypothetical protein
MQMRESLRFFSERSEYQPIALLVKVAGSAAPSGEA